MKILIAAETRSGTMLGSYGKAWREMGHEVRGITIPGAATESRSPWLRLARVPILNRIGLDQVRIEGNRVFTAEAIAWRPDLVVTGGFDLLPGSLITIKAATGCQLVMLFPDPLVSLAPEMVQSLPVYDLVAYACGTFALPYLERMGARRTAWLPFAWDPDVHPRPATDTAPEPMVDVGFVGEWRRDREQWLEALEGYSVGVWGGPPWRQRTSPNSVARRSWRGGIAWGAAYSIASRSAKITLNMVDVTNGPGLNMRAFEAAGIGCFILSTRTAALEEVFIDGEHIAYFDTPAVLRKQVEFYLSHAEDRERIAHNAAKLADAHTYRHRARELLDLIGDVSLPPSILGGDSQDVTRIVAKS